MSTVYMYTFMPIVFFVAIFHTYGLYLKFHDKISERIFF